MPTLNYINIVHAVGAGFEPAWDFLDPGSLANSCHKPLGQPTNSPHSSRCFYFINKNSLSQLILG